MTRYWFINIADMIDPGAAHGPFESEEKALADAQQAYAEGDVSIEEDLPCILITHDDVRDPELKAITREELAGCELEEEEELG